MATWDEVKDDMDRIASYYSRLYPKFEKWELINAVWAMGYIQKTDTKNTSLRIRNDIIHYIRTQARSPRRYTSALPFTNTVSDWGDRDDNITEPVMNKLYTGTYKVADHAQPDNEFAKLLRTDMIMFLLKNYPFREFQRDLIISHYIHGESLKSIGQRIGVSESRVYQLRFTALKALRGVALNYVGLLNEK